MKPMTKALLHAQEFAERAGVTVRTLHHYDRLGLLKPSGRTAAGYRLYGERDLARLQQIVTLKFIGFPLKEIKRLLDRGALDLPAALRLHREILETQRRHLDRAIKAIERAERAASAGGATDWEAFKNIIEVMQMRKDMEWVKQYYTEEQLADLASRWSPEVQEKAERDWAALIEDVEAARGEDPAGERAQALAARWEELINAFTGGDPGIRQSLENLYADRDNWPAGARDTWPAEFQKPYSDEAEAFINQAIAIRNKK